MFKAVIEKGKSLKSPPLSLRLLRTDPVDHSRVGFIIRKKAGNAVFRNAVRRVLREIFRTQLNSFPEPTWVIFDIMNSANSITRSQLRDQAIALLEKGMPKPKIQSDSGGVVS
jgi:ribonuclease P protein component